MTSVKNSLDLEKEKKYDQIRTTLRSFQPIDCSAFWRPIFCWYRYQSSNMLSESIDITAQEMKFSIKYVFSKCNKIRWRMCSTCCYMMVTLDVNELTVLTLLNEFVKKALQDFFTHKFSYVSFIFSYMVWGKSVQWDQEANFIPLKQKSRILLQFILILQYEHIN